MLTLVIGNRNYSSWSLRAWLYLAECGLEHGCGFWNEALDPCAHLAAEIDRACLGLTP